MPYVGQTITQVFPTSISVDSATISSNTTVGGTLGVTGETTLATHLNMGDEDKIKLGASGDLEIYHDGNNSFIKDTGTGNIYMQASDDLYITNASGNENKARFTTDGGVLLYFDNTQKFQTDTHGITVNGRQTILHNGASDYAMYVYNDGDNANRYGIYIQVGSDSGSGTSYLMAFVDGDGNGVGSITFSGSNASFNTSSDYRLKNNITDLTDATAKLKELKPKKFSWKKDTNNTLIHGFLAHEVAEVIPEAVVGEKDAVDDDDKPIYQGIDHSKIVPLLTKALQEQQATIEALTARITALESA